jgi:predicted HAD superfamily Cof-like phosphohydrolase
MIADKGPSTAVCVSPWDGITPVLGEDVMKAVAAFHRAFDIPIRIVPTAQPDDYPLRLELLREEWGEYVTAVSQNDVVEVADALAEMVYVIFGSALAHGIDLPAVLAEVHRSNMSKLGADGLPISREDGKVMKGPNYFQPDVARAIWPPDGQSTPTAKARETAGGAS